MADVPVKNSRRWQDFKFRYTADDGTMHITSQRISLDEAGNPFLQPTAMLIARQVTDNKTKLWGNPRHLRKLEIEYEESRNQTTKATLVRYLPYSPSADLKLAIDELIEACDAKFSSSNTHYCANYRGENRFTLDKPRLIREALNDSSEGF